MALHGCPLPFLNTKAYDYRHRTYLVTSHKAIVTLCGAFDGAFTPLESYILFIARWELLHIIDLSL